MTGKKAFDSVKMKWDIQIGIDHEFDGVPEDERSRLAWERIRRDPILGPFLARLDSPIEEASTRHARGAQQETSR